MNQVPGVTDGYEIRADSSGKQMIMNLNAHDRRYNIVPATKGPDSVMAGIEWLLDYQIIISPHCPHAQHEAERYSWEVDDLGQIIRKPVDAFNHVWDSVRMAVEPDRIEQEKVVAIAGIPRRQTSRF